MPLQIGQTLLNKYKIERVLGEGGFGRVYQAVDNLGRRVAVKELKAEFVCDPGALKRFQGEAIAIANLSNPNIVNVWGLEQESGHHYIILEFMDGGSLANLLAKRGKLSPGEAAVITQAVCNGLAATHRLGIIHRDIKSANILLRSDGTAVKLSDFGIAHVPAAVSNLTNTTRTGTAIGTPWYMSPEQARGQKVDLRSDLYSVGVMLYEMIAGYMYLDFTSDFLSDLEKLTTAPPRPMPADTPKVLQQIISKALAKDPAQRFQSAEEMAAALQAFITPGRTIAIPAPADSKRPVRPPVSSPRANPLLFIGIAVASLFAIFVVAMLVVAITKNSPSTNSQPTGAIQIQAKTTQMPSVPATVAVTPTDARTEAARIVFATQTMQVEAARMTEGTMQARVAASLTAAAPTITPTPTPTRPPTPTATPMPTASPSPTLAPSPTRSLFGLVLVSPPENTRFNTQAAWIILEWKPNPSSFVILADNEWYRVQVYTHEILCNFYTKDTSFTLPPSGQSGGGCDPAKWQFNANQITNWRVSFVVRVDANREHDIEKSNSEGRSFRWNK